MGILVLYGMGKRGTFDFGNTCPDIDKNIKDFKTSIQDTIEQIIEECSPMIPSATRKDLAAKWVDNLYRWDAEGVFENVRECNLDMRKEAERQIGSLEDQVSDLQNELDDANDQIESLKEELKNVTE